MIKLSKRLGAIAELVEDDFVIADIGCDHALLDIFLASKHPSKIIAIDVAEGAIFQAKKNIEKTNILSLDLRLGNGLEVITDNEVNTIIMSGIGCKTIISILKKDVKKLSMIDNLIIQSNNDHYLLRKNICEQGFTIASEVIVKENKHTYIIIRFKRGFNKYSDDDYYFGPILRQTKNSLYKEIVSKDLEAKKKALIEMPKKYFLGRIIMKRKIKKLEKEIS